MQIQFYFFDFGTGIFHNPYVSLVKKEAKNDAFFSRRLGWAGAGAGAGLGWGGGETVGMSSTFWDSYNESTPEFII